jgi:hypothetical protein
MPPRYLLDTNTASYIIKGNIARVREGLLQVPMDMYPIRGLKINEKQSKKIPRIVRQSGGCYTHGSGDTL